MHITVMYVSLPNPSHHMRFVYFAKYAFYATTRFNIFPFTYICFLSDFPSCADGRRGEPELIR